VPVPSRSREAQRLGAELEAMLASVDVPDAAGRDALRAAYARLRDAELDRSGVLRTHAMRLLGREPETRDRDLFVEAARTHCSDTGVDTSAEMRGLALLALSRVDPETARWLAAERLHDGEPPNQEPHATAVRILAHHGDHLIIREWLDGRGMGAQPAGAAALAEAELALAMPAAEWTRRAAGRLGDDRPVETLTAVEAVVREVRTELAGGLAALLRALDDTDLFRAVAMTLAASRESGFLDALLDVVEEVPYPLLDAYTDALAICRSPRRDEVLSRVSARARRGASPPE
jgi:hypothetical protein